MASTSGSSGTVSGSLFQIPGLGNGLDTTAVQTAMLAIAQRPILQLQKQQAQITAEQSAWRSVNSGVLGLGKAASALTSSTLGTARSASVTDSTILSASASPGNGSGTYSVTVKSLAQQHQMISQGYGLENATLGTGTVTIQVGPAQFSPITIDSSNNTLSGLARAINAAKVGVTANILDAGAAAGENRYRLTLNSNTSGEAAKITASFNLDSNAPTMTDLVAPQDAHVQLGTGPTALDIYSDSNTVSGAIPGVTLQLKTTSDKATQVTLSPNPSDIQSAVQSLITQYNSLNSTIQQQSSYDATTKTAGPLLGKSSLINLQSQVVSTVTGSHNVDGAYKALSDLGITLDSSGNLAITDQATFSSALSRNPSDVVSLLQDSTAGIGTQLNKLVSQYTDSTAGVLTYEDKSLTTSYSDLDKDIATKNRILEQEQTRITEMFARLQGTLGSLYSQNEYVTSQLDSMLYSSSSGTKK